MTRSHHLIVGTLVAGYFDGGHRTALVERITFPRRARRGSLAPVLVLRLWSGPYLGTGAQSWAAVTAGYHGRRVVVPVTRAKRVLPPPPNDTWIEAADFFEWAES